MKTGEWAPIGGPQNDGLFRNSRTRKIMFRKYREGKGEIKKSLKTTDLVRARRERDRLMVELWDDKPLRELRLTVSETWASWYAGMVEIKSAKTAESIRTAWANLKPYIETKFIDDVTAEWWLSTYIPQKRAEQNPRKGLDNSKRKFFNEWKWLSMHLKWAEENSKGRTGWRRPRLVNPDPERDEAQVYSATALASLRETEDLRERALLCAAVEHFMRRSEIIKLQWSRVNLLKSEIALKAEDTKIRKARAFPLNARLVEMLRTLKKQAPHSKFVFPSAFVDRDEAMSFTEFRGIWGRMQRRAKVKGKFHWLRHTGLTIAFKRARMDAARICHMAGLSLDEADRTYLHFKPDDLRGVESLVECS